MTPPNNLQEILDKQANRLNKNGKIQTTIEEQLARWAEHCKELLNRPPPDATPEMNRADEELKINLNVPSKTEIKKKYLGTDGRTDRGKTVYPLQWSGGITSN